MIDNSVTTAIVLDTRRMKKNGRFPAKVRITFARRQKYYSTKIDLTQLEYDKAFAPRPKKEYKDIKIKLKKFEQRATEIINELTVFSFEKFEEKFLSKKGTTTVFTLFDKKMIEAKKNSINTFESYRSAKKSIQEFAPNLKFHQITKTFLKKYQDWMLENGKSQTTVAIYLRNFRAIINRAISKGLMNKKAYPFGKSEDKFEITTGASTKKALDNDEISKLLNYLPEPKSSEQKYYDLWVFTYLCNGANMKDLALLKWTDLDNDTIKFIRAKTRRKSKEPNVITAYLTDRAKDIIKRWGNDPLKSDFIFPILRDGLTEKDTHNRIKQATKLTNKYISKIAQIVGVDKRITTYVARHSFGTVIMRNGGKTELIKELFGHSSVRVTENYMGEHDEDVKRDFAKKLTNL